MVNSGVGEYEIAVYGTSRKEIVDKDEEAIKKNILFEIEMVHPGESDESDIFTLKKGSYAIRCHIAGHYEAEMNGILIIK